MQKVIPTPRRNRPTVNWAIVLAEAEMTVPMQTQKAPAKMAFRRPYRSAMNAAGKEPTI
jgi:hypothetical protein